MGYLTDGLTFNTLRQANKQRLPQFKNSKGGPAHSEPDGSDWSPAQWLQAVLGEYANYRKKFERGDIDYDEFIIQAKKELADVQVYLDLLAFRLDIDLGKAVVAKFNEVSERVGSNVYIGDDGDWHLKSQN
jgi:NTP pyrophosphatase (non-canonical NTP hydrolase)